MLGRKLRIREWRILCPMVKVEDRKAFIFTKASAASMSCHQSQSHTGILKGQNIELSIKF